MLRGRGRRVERAIDKESVRYTRKGGCRNVTGGCRNVTGASNLQSSLISGGAAEGAKKKFKPPVFHRNSRRKSTPVNTILSAEVRLPCILRLLHPAVACSRNRQILRQEPLWRELRRWSLTPGRVWSVKERT